MSYHFDDPEEPPRSRPKTILYAVIVLAVIGGMLASAGAAVLWFTANREDPQPDRIAVPTLPQPTSTPPAGTVDDDASAEPPIVEGLDGINRIAYISPEGRVATISPDGRDGRLLSGEGLSFQFPAWSPDGGYLAAIGGDASGGGVYLLVDADEADQAQELYFSRSETPFYLYWSPDSRLVSFLANHPTDVLGMHLASVDPEEDERLLVTGSPLYWDWMAESDQIMIHIGFSGADARLALIDAFGDGEGANIASPGFFQAPDISADGRFLAYAEETSQGRSDLIIVDTETGDHQQARHAGLVAMGWSPTGDQLAMISSAEETDRFHGSLRLLDAVSGDVTLLSRKTVLAFFWSPDGRYIAIINAQGENDDLNAQAPLGINKQEIGRAKSGPRSELLSNDPLLLQQPRFLLELSIIEAATGQTRNLAAFQPTRMFLTQFLPFFDQYALSHRVWSPNSDALVIPMRIEGDDKVVVLSIDGQRSEPIADGNMPFWSHQ